MRRKDDSRKNKREEVKDRKIREKEKKRDELMQLKALKRKEILEKIEKLRKITGNDELAFKDEDLEDDFDPDKHDERMNQIFQQFDDAPLEGDNEKPVFSDLDSDLEIENWDEYGEDDENPDENFDANDDLGEETLEDQDIPENETNDKEQMQKELIEASTSSRAGRKKSKKNKSKFAEFMEAEKPAFDPKDEKKFDEYLDEYYNLDYEDIIGGDLPCRFKYRKVAANDLGLSTEEILSAPDRELNAWASLKKTCQYRSEQEEKADIEEYSKKKNNVGLKKKVLPSLFAQDPEENLEAEREKKAGKSKNARRRRKRNQLKEAGDKQENVQNPAQKRKIEEVTSGSVEEPKAKKKRNKKKKNKNNDQQQNQQQESHKQKQNPSKKEFESKKVDVNKELAMSDVRLEHYGLNKRKVRKQIFNAKNTCSTK